MGRGEYYRNKYGGGGGGRGGRGDGSYAGGRGEGLGGGYFAGGADGGLGAPSAPRALPASALAEELRRIDGRPYPAYRALASCRWQFGEPGASIGAGPAGPRFSLSFERVQADAYAPPSSALLSLEPADAALPPALLRTPLRRTATADFLLRALVRACAAAGADARAAGGGWRGAKGKAPPLPLLPPLLLLPLLPLTDGAPTAPVPSSRA